MSIDDRIRDRVAALTGITGTTIILRRITTDGGPAPSTNPPTGGPATVDAETLSGTSLITIAGGFRGRLVAGDAFSIAAGQIHTITGAIAAVGGKFIDIAFTPALAADAAAGAAVTFTYAADVTLTARIGSFPTRMVDGTAIRSTDLMVIIPGSALSTRPAPSDLILIGGVPHNVISADPQYVRDAVGLWRVQARG